MNSLADNFLASHGYAYEDEAAINEHLRCTICGEPMQEPVQLPCGHCYCSTCIRRWILTTPSCPIDRRPISGNPQLTSASRVILDMLDEIPVRCSLNCGWRGSRGSFKQHLATECPAVELSSSRSSERSPRRFTFGLKGSSGNLSSTHGSGTSLSSLGSGSSNSSYHTPSHSRQSSLGTRSTLSTPALSPGGMHPKHVHEAWSNHLYSRAPSAPTPWPSPSLDASHSPYSVSSRPPHLQEPSTMSLDEAFEGLSMQSASRSSSRSRSQPMSPIEETWDNEATVTRSTSRPGSRAPSRPSSPSRMHQQRASAPRLAITRGRMLPCDICHRSIRGTRWKCLDCPSYNICEDCHAQRQHSFHLFVPLRDPVDAQAYSAQPPDLSLGFPWS